MESQKPRNGPQQKRSKLFWAAIVFPAAVLAAYGVLYAAAPDGASAALRISGDVFLTILVPLGVVFIFMVLLNLFLKPGQVARFLGKGAGARGAVIAVAAGIVSAGPIYAWYPLLRDLREKGAGNSFLAVFLGNRAVKLFFLPVMVSYFGWLYVLILTLLTVLSSLVVGYSVGAAVREKPGPPAGQAPR